MSWNNPDPSSDERVLRDAQRTIERVVEAARVALDNEIALQQMEYDQVFGLNSMQFAMYQTLVMTFFQDHPMLASMNMKMSRPDLSHGVSESKRAQLMEVITERVAGSAQTVPPGMPSAQGAWQGQPQAAVPAQPAQTPAPSWQQPPAETPAPTASWLDPKTAASEPAAGDWLNQGNSKDRPPSTAWPTSAGQESSQAWTLKPGGGQPPALPAESASRTSTPSSTGWPSPNEVNQPAPASEPPSSWPAPNANSAAPWPEQRTASKQLPPAAWPASNSGAVPAAESPPLPDPPSTARPWHAPIGEAGQSGTWTLPPNPTNAPPAQPPAPAWESKPATQGLPPAAWEPSAGNPNPGQPQWTPPAPVNNTPPAPAWEQPPVPPANPAPVAPAPAQPWQDPAQNQQQQPWQPPSQPANQPQPWQQAPTTPAPVWQEQQLPPGQPQPWQQPVQPAPAAQPAQPWQAPAMEMPPSPPPQPWQGAQQQPATVPPQAGAQPWTPAGQPQAQQPNYNNGSQNPWGGQDIGLSPSAVPQPQPQPQYQNQPPQQYPANSGQPNQYQNQPAQFPQNLGMPTQNQPVSYPTAPPQPPQFQTPGPPPGSTMDGEMSISFPNQDQQAGQGPGGTLSGVLKQMRNFDATRRRSDNEEERKEPYNPNNAW